MRDKDVGAADDAVVVAVYFIRLSVDSERTQSLCIFEHS